jgi:hypothetical protein
VIQKNIYPFGDFSAYVGVLIVFRYDKGAASISRQEFAEAAWTADN